MSTVTELTPTSDQRLMRAFHRRDAAAARTMYRRYGALVYGVGLRHLGSAERASAMAEATFVELWRRAPRYLSGLVRLDSWVLLQALTVVEELCRVSECPDTNRSGPLRLADAGPIPA